MKKRIVLASANKGKIKEISEMLKGYEVVGYKDLGIDYDIEEDGNSFYENALIKAKNIAERLGVPALADDSGLCVDYLKGAPGIYSARYAGDGIDEHNNDLLLKNLSGVTDRKAYFICVMVLYSPDGSIITAEGKTYGEILTERRGTNGFGYDPLFYSYDLNKSLGEATDEEKNSISHRSRALQILKESL